MSSGGTEDKSGRYINRELSWLDFNERVLEEARDPTNRLLERLKFATIVCSNLDEFFMVRVAALINSVREGETGPDKAGLTPSQQLASISARAHRMVDGVYETVLQGILPALAERGIGIVPAAELPAGQQTELGKLFTREILPALTPLAIDSSRPFPMLAGLSLNLALLLDPVEEGESERLAVVQVPGRLPRLVRPPGGDGSTYTWIEEVIRAELGRLFPGQKILESGVFRVTRDSELEFDDEGGRDFLQTLEGGLRKRRRSRVVRLEVEAGASDRLVSMLSERLRAGASEVYRVNGPLDLRALFTLLDLPALEDLRDSPIKSLPLVDLTERREIFKLLNEKDILLHHPYDSFDPVVALVSEAAEDPDVLAIKQTLYRTGGDSQVVRALARAAERGKQVTVLVELTARFDEGSNIRWARSLEEAGAHVIYGIRGLKTHSKICLVVRRGRQGIRRYVHLGTGNYNEKTARLYTDFGLMTSDPATGEDASAFFNALTGYSDPPRLRSLVMAPSMLRQKFMDLIHREERWAIEGRPAAIRAKMNSLVDGEIIRCLYDASRAGVKVMLNVRGICCLRPGLQGVSETIQVVSIVDRFLEHSRVFHFLNGGDEEVWLSSADWMPRNLDRRIELLFPVQDEQCRRKVLTCLDAMFLDNVKARRLRRDGVWERVRPAAGEEACRAQVRLYEDACRVVERAMEASGGTFEPLSSRPAETGERTPS